MNNKAQLDNPAIAFFVIIVALAIIGIMTLKIMNEVKAPLSNAFGNVSGGGGAIAQSNVNYGLNLATNMWDKITIAFFFMALLTLVISAFLIDTNPFWIILYVITCFFLMLFAPSIFSSLDNIYDASSFSLESSQLSFIGFLREHFGEVLVGVMMLTGIIIFGKVAFFKSGGGGRL